MQFSFVEPLPEIVVKKGRGDVQLWKAPAAELPETLKGDFQTPKAVAEYMTQLLPVDTYHVLEPTPGKGNIVAALNRWGIFNITAPADWWELDKSLRFDAVVCNFPFSAKTFWNCPEKYKGGGMAVLHDQLKVVMEMSDSVIALVPWFVLIDSDARTRAMLDYGLISVTSLPRKVFNYARIQTCILELCKGYGGITHFRYFKF